MAGIRDRTRAGRSGQKVDSDHPRRSRYQLAGDHEVTAPERSIDSPSIIPPKGPPIFSLGSAAQHAPRRSDAQGRFKTGARRARRRKHELDNYFAASGHNGRVQGLLAARGKSGDSPAPRLRPTATKFYKRTVATEPGGKSVSASPRLSRNWSATASGSIVAKPRSAGWVKTGELECRRTPGRDPDARTLCRQHVYTRNRAAQPARVGRLSDSRAGASRQAAFRSRPCPDGPDGTVRLQVMFDGSVGGSYVADWGRRSWWLDPRHGYAAVQDQSFSEGVMRFDQWDAYDDFLQSPRGIWYPTLMVRTRLWTQKMAEQLTSPGGDVCAEGEAASGPGSQDRARRRQPGRRARRPRRLISSTLRSICPTSFSNPSRKPFRPSSRGRIPMHRRSTPFACC